MSPSYVSRSYPKRLPLFQGQIPPVLAATSPGRTAVPASRLYRGLNAAAFPTLTSRNPARAALITQVQAAC
jgi:hypothetical protein